MECCQAPVKGMYITAIKEFVGWNFGEGAGGGEYVNLIKHYIIAFLRTNLSTLHTYILVSRIAPPFMPYRPSTIAQPRIKYMYIFITSASIQVQYHEFVSCAIPIDNKPSSFVFKELHYIIMTTLYCNTQRSIIVLVYSFNRGTFPEK